MTVVYHIVYSMQEEKIYLTIIFRCVIHTPKNKSQENFLGFIYYFVGLLIVKVASKPSIRTAIPSKTIKVWITVFISI